MKGTRSPGRDKILRLCLAAGLTFKETTRALELGGCAILYARNRRDIILTVSVNQHASVDETNLLLFKYGEEPVTYSHHFRLRLEVGASCSTVLLG